MFELGSIFSREARTRRQTQRMEQSCSKCGWEPFVELHNDPKGLMCPRCRRQYPSSEIGEMYHITIIIDYEKAGPGGRTLLADLLRGTDLYSDGLSPDAYLGSAIKSSDRKKWPEFQEITDAVNRSKIKGVSARCRIRHGWSHLGPFVIDDEPSKWGGWLSFSIDWLLRLAGLCKLVEEVIGAFVEWFARRVRANPTVKVGHVRDQQA